MAIPDYQTLMLPVLKLAADGAEHKFRDAVGFYPYFTDISEKVDNGLGGLLCHREENTRKSLSWRR